MGVELPPTTWYTECPRCAGTATWIKEIPRTEMGPALRGVADPADVRVLVHFLGNCRHVWGVIVYEDGRREKYNAWTAGDAKRVTTSFTLMRSEADRVWEISV